MEAEVKARGTKTYRLQGHCTVQQYCYRVYPSKTKLEVLRICDPKWECVGHEITLPVDETITVPADEKHITDESLTQHEVGMDLEPTWEPGYTITEVQ